MKNYYFLGLLALALSFSPASHAQAVPMATKLGSVQVGAGFTFANSDYSPIFIKGFTVYGDADLSHRLGVEADMHYISILTPNDFGENTYLIGPRFSLLRRDRVNAYVKVMGGLGSFVFQQGDFRNPHTDNYGVFSVGGGIDFRASQHINIRAIDIEAQRWPGLAPHGLTPFVTTFGAAYAF